jgi:hypothetical protein
LQGQAAEACKLHLLYQVWILPRVEGDLLQEYFGLTDLSLSGTARVERHCQLPLPAQTMERRIDLPMMGVRTEISTDNTAPCDDITIIGHLAGQYRRPGPYAIREDADVEAGFGKVFECRAGHVVKIVYVAREGRQ